MAYAYRQEVLEQLAQHGFRPMASTTPQQLRDGLRDLYKYEIKVLRSSFLAGRIAKPDYAGHVIALRKRYWLLSVPLQLWTAE